ncbi:MAG TPA: hypothetical protein VN201_10775 [Roseateles sp.]|nr:hypothetical protein [Roseateles sp.]
MNATVENIIPATLPKSDQLNAEQLLPGPMTITVTDVTVKVGEQPVTVHYEGEEGRPYKPCKTMLRVLCLAWTENGNNWRGKSMTLYNDPTVRFGGDEIGGIRISHMSDIPDDIEVKLTKTRGKKALHTIKRLATVSTEDIDNAPTVEALKDNFGAAYKANKAPHIRARLKAAYDARLAILAAASKTAGKTLEQYREDVESAADATAAQAIVESARTALGKDDYAELQQAYRMAWEG